MAPLQAGSSPSSLAVALVGAALAVALPAAFAAAPPLWFCVLCPTVLGLLAPIAINLLLNQVRRGPGGWGARVRSGDLLRESREDLAFYVWTK